MMDKINFRVLGCISLLVIYRSKNILNYSINLYLHSTHDQPWGGVYGTHLFEIHINQHCKPD